MVKGGSELSVCRLGLLPVTVSMLVGLRSVPGLCPPAGVSDSHQTLITQQDWGSTKPLNRAPCGGSQSRASTEAQARCLTMLSCFPSVTLSTPWAPLKPSTSNQESRPWPTSTRASSTRSPCVPQQEAKAWPCPPTKSRCVGPGAL